MIDKEIDSIFYHVICRQELSSVIVCYYLTFTEPSKLLVLIQARIFRLYLFYFFFLSLELGRDSSIARGDAVQLDDGKSQVG